jgi:hypothetical protein
MSTATAIEIKTSHMLRDVRENVGPVGFENSIMMKVRHRSRRYAPGAPFDLFFRELSERSSLFP